MRTKGRRTFIKVYGVRDPKLEQERQWEAWATRPIRFVRPEPIRVTAEQWAESTLQRWQRVVWDTMNTTPEEELDRRYGMPRPQRRSPEELMAVLKAMIWKEPMSARTARFAEQLTGKETPCCRNCGEPVRRALQNGLCFRCSGEKATSSLI